MNSTFTPPEESIAEPQPEAVQSTSREIPESISEIAPAQTTAPVLEPPKGTIDPPLPPTMRDSFIPGQVAASTFSPFTPSAEQSPFSPPAEQPSAPPQMAQQSISPQAEQQSPSTLRPDSRAATGLDHARADTQSIRSSTTSGSQGGHRHPELHETGLNASIVETISARFENGRLTSSSMIGEIALAYNPANFSSPFGTENIRLDGFSSLEKVAPNPAFVNPLTEIEGGYSVNLSNLGKTQVAFKYQVRLDNSGSQAPLLIAPAFRPESNQFSVIVNYSLNPNFTLRGRETITLSNVMLAFTLEGAKATSCLSKPAGTFSRERNLIFWQLNDIILTPGAAPQKLLARFATETEATGGSVEARWEISGENAQGLGSGLSVSVSGQTAATGTDPFADESGQASNWKAVPGPKKLTSGNYSAK